jgi:hypothetical protein
MYPFVGCYKNVSGGLVPYWTNPCNPAQELAGCVKKQSGVRFPVLTAGTGDSCPGPLYGCDKIIDGKLSPVIEFADYASFDEMMGGCCTPCEFCIGQVPDLIRLLVQNFTSGKSGICQYQSYPSRWWKLVGYSDSMLNGTHYLSAGPVGSQAYYGTCNWWVCYTVSPIQKRFYDSEAECQSDTDEYGEERQYATKLMIRFYLASSPPPKMNMDITLQDANNYPLAFLDSWTARSETVPIDCMKMHIVLPDAIPAWQTGVWYEGWESENWAEVVHNGIIYQAISGHTSDPTTEPGVGANWTYYWSVMRPYPLTTYTITNGSTPSTPGWAVGNHYLVNQCVTHQTGIYRCTQDHLSTFENEPGVGANWGSYWAQIGCD